MSPERPDPRDTKPTEAESPAIDATRYAWPTAELDPVERMRALAAAMPHVAVDETVFDVDFDHFWSFISDFERTTSQFEYSVSRARIINREPEPEGGGERLVLHTLSPLGGPWVHIDVVLRPGWCLMHTRVGDIGMSARPEPNGKTRFFHFEGSSVLGRIAKPLFAWNIRQDFRKLRRLL